MGFVVGTFCDSERGGARGVRVEDCFGMFWWGRGGRGYWKWLWRWDGERLVGKGCRKKAYLLLLLAGDCLLDLGGFGGHGRGEERAAALEEGCWFERLESLAVGEGWNMGMTLGVGMSLGRFGSFDHALHVLSDVCTRDLRLG